MEECLDFLWVYIYKHLLRRVKIFTQYDGHYLQHFFPFFNNFWGLLRMYGFEPSFCWFQNLVFFGNVFLHFYINQCYKLASPFLLNQKPIYCTYCETYASGIYVYKVYSFFFLMAPFFPFFFRLKMGKLRGTVAEQGSHISFKNLLLLTL